MSDCKMFDVKSHSPKELCIPLISSRIKPPKVSISEGFDFGTALQSFYPLLDIVFDYLNFSDLNSASLVNNAWQVTAKKVLRRRACISWVNYVRTKSGYQLRTKENYGYKDRACDLIFFDPKRIKLSDYVCCHYNISQLSRMTFAEYLAKDVVPTGIDYCVISSASVSPPFVQEDYTLNEYGSLQGIFQALSLPKIPNIRIEMFHCGTTHVKTIRDCAANVIHKDEMLKCLLVFPVKSKSLKHFVTTFIEGHECSKVALGGGIIKGAKSFLQSSSKRTFKSSDYFCIAFLGNTNVPSTFTASSIVITDGEVEEVNSSKNFEYGLASLQTKYEWRENALAFRFCCNGKNRAKVLETSTFEKLFPGVPLMGIEVDGEIGWDTSQYHSKEPSSVATSLKTIIQCRHRSSEILLRCSPNVGGRVIVPEAIVFLIADLFVILIGFIRLLSVY